MIARVVCRPFIGRHEELAYLHERRLDASAGRGGVALVAGEAGVGKSRLIAEFRRSLVKSRSRISVGQCLEFAQRPYGPVLDVLARFDPQSLDLVPAETKREQFDALVDRFARAAAHSALIAIFEDLHWADAATLEFIAYLATKLDSLRILIVASYRPEDLERADNASGPLSTIARGRRVGRVDLRPLSGPELRMFIDEALVGIDLPAETRRAVARASEGNPFFTEELLNSAVASGKAARPNEPRYLPGTIRATVTERLAPLADNDRRILAQAAVIGRRFGLSLLCETVETDRDTVLSTLRRLRDLQLIDEEPGDLFRFRHALTREAIYDGFLGAEVRPMHRKIALVLSAADGPDRFIEGLAYHWWAAGDRERGAHFNELAGDIAGSVFAHDDAIASYERALQLVPDESRERAILLAKIGRHRSSVGLHAVAEATLTEAAEIFERLEDWDSEATYRSLAAQNGVIAGTPDAVAPLEAMLARLPADAHRARSRLRLERAFHEAGFAFRPDAAMTHLADIDEASVIADPEMTRTHYSVSALVHCLTGDVAALRADTEKALGASLAVPHTDRAVHVYINAAMEFGCLDQRDDARSFFRTARELAVARKSRNLEAHIEAMSASVLYIDGDLDGVRRAVDAAAALRVESAIVVGHCAAWGTLAGLALGDECLIEKWFSDSPDAMSTSQMDYFAAGYAEILTRRGRPMEGQALLHDAIQGGDIRRGIVCTLLAVARLGNENDFARARALLVAATSATVEVLERPGLALFDAFVARRAGRSDMVVERAREAAAGFCTHRAPLLEASALELAGDVPAALIIYRRLGAAGDVRRISGRSAAHKAPENSKLHHSPLSRREMEIAILVGQGSANLEIARRLSISHKTVEKHLTAVYQKLGITTRAQLATWIARSHERAP